MKILLATDGSECSNIAVEELAGRSLPSNSEVLVISVFDSTPLITGIPVSMGDLTGAWEEANNILKKLAAKAVEDAVKILKNKNPNVPVSTKVIEGSPKQIILQEAERYDADLIVVGSHGRGAARRFLLGSVSQSVALHAKCSVEIARKKNNFQ